MRLLDVLLKFHELVRKFVLGSILEIHFYWIYFGADRKILNWLRFNFLYFAPICTKFSLRTKMSFLKGINIEVLFIFCRLYTLITMYALRRVNYFVFLSVYRSVWHKICRMLLVSLVLRLVNKKVVFENQIVLYYAHAIIICTCIGTGSNPNILFHFNCLDDDDTER